MRHKERAEYRPRPVAREDVQADGEVIRFVVAREADRREDGGQRKCGDRRDDRRQ
jgi:hypothetical protein